MQMFVDVVRDVLTISCSSLSQNPSCVCAGTNVSFVGSTFLHNAAAFHGAGIMCIFGLAYIKDTVIADNM